MVIALRMPEMYQILILGGGFAGLMGALNAAAENDRHAGNGSVRLVPPSPYLTIRPRLYERHPETLRAPLAPTLGPAGITFVQAIARTGAPCERRRRSRCS